MEPWNKKRPPLTFRQTVRQDRQHVRQDLVETSTVGISFSPEATKNNVISRRKGVANRTRAMQKKGKTADKPENSEQYVKRGLTATAYARKSQAMLTAFTLERSIPSLQAGWSLGLHFGWIHQEWSGLLDLAEGKGRLANKLKRPSPKSGGCNFTVLKNDL